MDKAERRLECGYVRNHFYSAVSGLTALATTIALSAKHINLEIAGNPVGLELTTTGNIVFGTTTLAAGWLAKKFYDRAETCMLYLQSDRLRSEYGTPSFMRPHHA